MKIPVFWQDANVARVAVAGCGAARRGGVPQRVEHRGAIGDAARHQVDDALFAALHLTHDQHQPRRTNVAATAFAMPPPAQYIVTSARPTTRETYCIAIAVPLVAPNKA